MENDTEITLSELCEAIDFVLVMIYDYLPIYVDLCRILIHSINSDWCRGNPMERPYQFPLR